MTDGPLVHRSTRSKHFYAHVPTNHSSLEPPLSKRIRKRIPKQYYACVAHPQVSLHGGPWHLLGLRDGLDGWSHMLGACVGAWLSVPNKGGWVGALSPVQVRANRMPIRISCTVQFNSRGSTLRKK